MASSLSAVERASAYLADPQRPRGELEWSSCDAALAAQILRQHKVPLVSVVASQGDRAIVDHPAFQGAQREESGLYERLRCEYRTVSDELASHGICGVMIKSVGPAPSFPYRSGNLDVLYHADDVPTVRSTLESLKYVELRNLEEPHKYLFYKFHGGQRVSAIHVHAHVGWVVSFLDEESLWRRAHRAADDDLIAIPGITDALLTTLAHWLYEDKRLSLMDVKRCAYCLRSGVDWDEAYRVADCRGWRDGLDVALLLYAHQERGLYGECLVPSEILRGAEARLTPWLARWMPELRTFCDRVKSGESQVAGAAEAGLMLTVPFVLSKALFYAKLARDPSRSRWTRVRDLVYHSATGTKLRLGIQSQPRFLVTFSGIDGSGKTTQAEALKSSFEECLIQARHVWTRGGSSRWVASLSRLAKRYLAPPPDESPSPQTDVVRRRKHFRSAWFRLGWTWVLTAELLWEYSRRVTVPLLRGRVVICDRYVQDLLADWEAYFGELGFSQRLAATVLRVFTPKPDAAFWLRLSDAEAAARSSDHLPADFRSAQTGAFAKMANDGAVEPLNAERPWRELSDDIVHQMVGRYYAGYRTVLNALFLKNPGQWR